MRYALIGCGRIAPSHIQSALSNGLEIAGLCDLSLDKAKSLARRFSLPESLCFADAGKMLESVKDLGFVSIAADSGSHHDLAMLSFRHGLDVLTEKPIAMSLADAREMIDTARNNGLLLGVCQQNRLNNASVLVKKAIDRGAFGTISNASVAVRWSRGRSYYGEGDWRGKWRTDGGTLMNQCIHGFDLLRYFCGRDIDTLYAKIANRAHSYIETEDLGLGVIHFSNGILATAEGTSNVFRDNLEEVITIIGEKGTVKLGGECAERITLWRFEDEEVDSWKTEEQRFSSVYGDGHSRVFEDFIRSAGSRKRPAISGEDGYDALEMVLAFYLSAKEGRPVAFPLPPFGTEDMEGVALS